MMSSAWRWQWRRDSLAEPGQILVSGVVKELVEDRDLTALLLDEGRRPIRGLESALHVYRVEWQTG